MSAIVSEFKKTIRFEVVSCLDTPSIVGVAKMSVEWPGEGETRTTRLGFAVIKVVFAERKSPPSRSMRKEVYVYVAGKRPANEIAEARNAQEIAKELAENYQAGSDPGDDPDYVGA